MATISTPSTRSAIYQAHEPSKVSETRISPSETSYQPHPMAAHRPHRPQTSTYIASRRLLRLSVLTFIRERHVLSNALGRSAGSVSLLLAQSKAVNLRLRIIFVNSTGRLKHSVMYTLNQMKYEDTPCPQISVIKKKSYVT
ncbi:hypothetical protein PAXINDRAFT_21253 [Paxillus involutus ATCC 200175]|uniref:Uncharacterized protein n=1 Tax=Paxillus involutus ATCC 200175 TaxID=664439 RepID=A0A0C9STI7_PAXIN|nr:hypothetical protein PAXINDRAFT_21253 [Paxillus involutus ATCC 200175]